MKKILFFILSVWFSVVCAQDNITAVNIFARQTPEKFTNEWLYVSTDLYLLNGDKFTYLIRKTNPTNRRRRFKKKAILENLLVTANITGLKGYEGITYPIFSYHIQTDEKGNYIVESSESEVLRIIDNFPVSSVSDQISAKIQIRAFTRQNKSELYKFVGAQLQNVSALQNNPTDAVFALIGEFGKLLSKDAAGEQYQFESTIRVYEDQNFNKKFHSISIFIFKPMQSYTPDIDTSLLAEFLDTVRNPKFGKSLLQKLIPFRTYPMIIAINYRSKYIPQIPDEVDFESLKQRAVKNENDYKSGTISQDVYIQEKNLIDFLEVFAQLKLDVNNYELDYKAKITEDFTIELFIILQDYWKLKNFYKTIAAANKDNPLYENEFRPIYDLFLTKAALYLESNASLRNIKELVNLLYNLENDNENELDSAAREDYLEKLYSIELPERELYSDEAKTIKKWIDNLEQAQFYLIYNPKIEKLKNKPVNEETYQEVKRLQNQIAKSACMLCRNQVSEFTTVFYEKYDDYLFDRETDRFNNLKITAKAFAYSTMKKVNNISSNIDSLYSGEIPEYLKLIKNDLQKIKNQINTILDITSQESPQTLSDLKTANNTIEDIMHRVEMEIKSICNQNKEICKCEQTQ